MNYWILTLLIMNILMMATVLLGWFSQRKNQVEDQRLTKGLQLLQNKISILQDLSDKSDEQVHRWIHLLEQKSAEVQKYIHHADHSLMQIETTLQKALDVSKVFSEQVPHAEIAERQKTSKYVHAAQLANQGFSVEEISQKIDLSPAEIEIIMKLNRDELQFSEENLPAWINSVPNQPTRTQEITEFNTQLKKMNQLISETSFEVPKPDLTTMKRIEQDFKNTVLQSTTSQMAFIEEPLQNSMAAKESPTNSIVTPSTEKNVRPFEFRKISIQKN